MIKQILEDKVKAIVERHIARCAFEAENLERVQYVIEGALVQFLLDCPEMGISVEPSTIRVKVGSLESYPAYIEVMFNVPSGALFSYELMLEMVSGRLFGEIISSAR